MAYKITLLSAEVRLLWVANEVLSKRRRAKKTRIRQGGILIVEDIQDIIAQKEAEEQVRRDSRKERASHREGHSSARRYRACEKLGYNTQTCQETIEVFILLDSE